MVKFSRGDRSPTSQNPLRVRNVVQDTDFNIGDAQPAVDASFQQQLSETLRIYSRFKAGTAFEFNMYCNSNLLQFDSIDQGDFVSPQDKQKFNRLLWRQQS